MGDKNAHARLAPSHADTWFYCAGSVNLEATLPPDPTGGETEHSRRGVAAHEALEQCIQKGVTRANFDGQTMSNGVTLNAEDNAAVQVALDWIESLKAHAASKRLPFQIFSEEKVEIGRYLGRDDIDGTIDFQMFYGNTLGSTGRAGSVKDVGDIIRSCMAGYPPRGRLAECLPLGIETHEV